MWSYILKRFLLMIPTGIGIVTVFFVISELVPGGPLDQVEAMIVEQANEAGMGDMAMFGDDSAKGSIKIDPEVRMQIKRKLGLNYNALERYCRMLLSCSPDSLISSKEIGDREARKISFQEQKLWVYRENDTYHVFENRYTANKSTEELRFDQGRQSFVSVMDENTTFDPRTGRRSGGGAALTQISVIARKKTFNESDYRVDGTQIKVKETRDEVYLRESFLAKITNWDNWHGMFLLKFPNSITYNKKSFEVIREKLPVSMRLGIISFFLTYSLCILLGVSKAAKNGTLFDSVTSVLVLIGYGIPGFVLAMFLIKAFGPGSDSWVRLIPLKGIQSPPHIYELLGFWGKLWDNVHHLIAPILCLTIGSFAGLTILTKNSVLEELNQLYAVAARARGLSKRKVLIKHVLRNSLIPLVTGFPARFVMMFFAGSLLIEKIFSLDGLGLLGYTAMIERDYPLIISNMFVFTYIGLICRLLSDIGYVIVDPRIGFEGSTT